MEHVLFFVGVVCAAACFARIEVHVEGAGGWAANLPTWRLKSAWYDRVFPGRPLTGYHLWILLFIAVVAHLPFAFGLPWTWRGEMRAVAFILFFWVCEDFLWFVFNPHYGVRRFRPECIEWHRRAWWWVAPRDYWIATAAALVLYISSRRVPEEIVLVMR